MAEQTAISWADATQNFWLGCTKISPACDHCYAESWAKRAGMADLWQGRRQRTKTWGEPLKWQQRAKLFFGLYGRKRRVFTNSLADFFDNEVETAWRDDAWAVIKNCPDLEWLIVTKRVSNIEKMLPHFCDFTAENFRQIVIIITVINQAEADRDVPRLLKLKAKYPWLRVGLSVEPMLGAIDLEQMPFESGDPRHRWSALTGQALMYGTGKNGYPDVTVRMDKPMYEHLDWVIVGGESGGEARNMAVKWAIDLLDQCLAAGVPFHFKQIGDNHEGWGNNVTGKGKEPAEWPAPLRVQDFTRAA